MWRPHSDCSDCNSDRTNPGKQRCERRASTLGLHWLWPVLVATQLPPWLRRLRVLPSSSLLASSSPPPPLLLLMMITVAEHTSSATLLTDKCSHRPQGRHCEAFSWMSALPPKADMGAQVSFRHRSPSLLVIARIGFVPHLAQDAAGRPLIVRRIDSHHRLVKSVGNESM
jgi:hypothetical protein